MLGWIKRKAQIAILKSMDEDIERFIAGIKGGSALEVGHDSCAGNEQQKFFTR